MAEQIAVLDHGYVGLIETWGSDERIVESARMSTQKGFLGWGPVHADSCPRVAHSLSCEEGSRCSCSPKDDCRCDPKPGDEKLLRYLLENDHATPFEMAGLTIEVQAPIFVFREWHRHRVPFGYSEASARYAPLPTLDYVPSLERMLAGGGHLTRQAGAVAGSDALTEAAAEAWLKGLEEIQRAAETHYQAGLQLGVPKELARLSMTLGRYSKMRATGNLRGWMGFLVLRDSPKAQAEIRVYAQAVRRLLVEAFPRSMALFAERKK